MTTRYNNSITTTVLLHRVTAGPAKLNYMKQPPVMLYYSWNGPQDNTYSTPIPHSDRYVTTSRGCCSNSSEL